MPEYLPLLGHSATQVPSLRNGVAPEVQLAHSELVAPVQVPHKASHGWQMLLLSANLATGRQEARHVPAPPSGPSKKGCDEAHVVHWSSDGPEHVLHDAWHATHLSAELALPPEHVKPASIEQLASHPSKLTWF